MTRFSYQHGLGIILLAAVVAGCGSAAPAPSAASAPSAPGQGGTFSIAELEPPSFLPGQDTGVAEDEVNALFAPLTKFNAEKQLTDVQAQSVTPADGGRLWTIKIKPGWTFHDGEPVTAQSYVNAWNATAYGPNAWGNNGSFADFAGYPALNPATGKPVASTLSGLTAPDATTIQVRLIRPDSQFPLELTTPAFLPLPNAYFKGPAAWDSAPVGDGPFEVAGPWQPNKSLTVKRYAAYRGQRPSADGIVFDIYTSLQSAYTAVQAGQVDVSLIGPATYGAAEKDMPNDVVAYNAPSIDYLGFPLYNSDFKNKLTREAISLAINRPAISTALFGGLTTPATSILPPAEAGAPLNVCPYCRYDPALARKLLAEAGGWKGPLVLWYPSGVGYDQVMQAIANQLTENLGIKSITFNASSVTSWVASLAAKKMTNGITIGHWGAFFPSMQNTLTNLFEPTGTVYFETNYSSPALTKSIQQGDGSSLAASQAYYRQAEQLTMNAFPVVPLFYNKYVYVHGPAVSNVIVDTTQIELSDVIVK
jgi:oligopeptide transport system substrate-binding protein